MCLHLSVSHSVHRGVCILASTGSDTRLPSVCWYTHTPAQCMLEYKLPPGQTPHPMATAADGMHPTVIYLFIIYNFLTIHLCG